jgi:16S rRNA (cytosine1407-C5)-methyltransferase
VPPSFRFNPLKHSLAFQKEILSLEDFKYIASPLPAAFQVTKQPHSIGKSLSHFLGHIYIQDLASMLPPLVLQPRSGERVLDLCAAPGSKTTQLAALMGNRGAILANDVSTKRLKSLVFNLRRTGVTNTAVVKSFGQQLGNLYFECFDRVLIDAPCSALGTIHKSPEVANWWTPARSRRLAANQNDLLQSGLKALRPGGVLVYSTCTITPEENEEVISHALNQFPVILERISLPGLNTRPGLSDGTSGSPERDLENAVRIYPFENSCEGFFIARLRKTDSFGTPRHRRPVSQIHPHCEPSDPRVAGFLHQIAQHFKIPSETFEQGLAWPDATLAWSTCELGSLPFFEGAAIGGLPIVHVRGQQTKLTTEGSHLFGHQAQEHVTTLNSVEELEAYVNRDPLRIGLPPSQQVLISFKNSIIGHALVDKGTILSRIPRVGWRFSLKGA